jgi:conserved oligomeric Golgi complex subunit 4
VVVVIWIICVCEKLDLVRIDGEGLAESVKATSNLSERVSAKVRELDSAQSHVRSTISCISIIVDRTQCIYGVKESLEKEDFESAAAFVSTFLGLEDTYGPLAVEDSKQFEEQQQVACQFFCVKAFNCVNIFDLGK